MKIITIQESNKEFGIFFRWPMRKVQKDEYEETTYSWLRWAKFTFFPRLYNWKEYYNVEDWREDIDFAGFTILEFCSPLYFKRFIRKAFHKIIDHSCIDSIEVKGEICPKFITSGKCIWEKTKFKYLDCSSKIFFRYGAFHFYYKHVVEEEIKE